MVHKNYKAVTGHAQHEPRTDKGKHFDDAQRAVEHTGGMSSLYSRR